VALAALACDLTPQAPAIPAPATATPGQPVRPSSILPTVAPDLSVTTQPTTTRTVQPTAAARPTANVTPTTSSPAAQPTAAPTRAATATRPAAPPPTADPKLIIVREEDISRAIAGGAGEEQGVKAQGLQVRLRDGKMTVSADELGLGPVQVKQLVMVGRLLAQSGQLRFESESVSPRGLVTGLLPALANQALTQYASQWYVEEVQTRDGRLELRIR
jgi:hypothetical protein